MTPGLWIDLLRRDLRYALRRLAAHPAFAIVATLSLGLGIGANTAAFGVLHAVVLRALPVRDPGTLAVVAVRNDARQYSMSYPAYAWLRDHARGIDGAIAFHGTAVNVQAAASTARAQGMLVSGNYFELLGVEMALGTPIRPDDDRIAGSGGARGLTVVLSHDYWVRRFASDPTVIGRGLRVNGAPMTIVGIAPRGFHGTRVGTLPDLFMPIAFATRLFELPTRLENPRDNWLRLMVRRAPGVTPAQAQAEMTSAFRRFNEERVIPLVTTDQARRRVQASVIVLAPGRAGLSELPVALRPALFVLMGLVGVVLLLACVNVANLLVARAERQHRDTAIHLALGASALRLWIQTLVESLVLGVAGLACGLVLAAWMRGLLVRLAPASAQLDTSMDAVVFGAAALLGLGAAIFLALIVCWQQGRRSLVQALKGADAGARPWMRQGLIVGQLALSIVVVAAAVLFGQTLRNLQLVDAGYTRDDVLLASFDPHVYPRARQQAFYARLLDETRATPGVRSAALASDEPLDVSTGWGMRVRNPRTGVVETQSVPVLFVSTAYFETMGIPIVAGRDLAADADLAGASPTVLVNETFVSRYLAGPAASAIGARVSSLNQAAANEIVGVVRDTASAGLRAEAEPTMYLPVGQRVGPMSGRLVLHVRAAVPAAGLAETIAARVRRGDPEVTMFDVRTMEQHVARALGRERTFAQLSSVFGLLALGLSAVGLYGIIAYAVSRRTRELGIRLALGASRGGVVRLVLREAARLVLLGAMVGLPLAYAVSGAFGSLLYGVEAGDARTLAAAVLLLGLVAMLSAWAPARRAARVDPLIALRYD